MESFVRKGCTTRKPDVPHGEGEYYHGDWMADGSVRWKHGLVASSSCIPSICSVEINASSGPATNVKFPSLCLQDGPLGIRFADRSTAFPAGITVGATWNRDLMYAFLSFTSEART